MIQQSTPLQEWMSAHPVRDEMFWQEPAGQQMMFVRDRIAGLVGYGLEHEQRKLVPTVISTHRSKSIELPVYELCRPDRNLRIILRENFFNWKMSVINDYPVVVDFDGLFHTTPPTDPDYTGNELHPVYFEGFPEDLIFGYYESSDKCRFSAAISGDHALWTSIFLIMRSLGVVQPFKWQTRGGQKGD